MPLVYSVDDITNILSGIIANAAQRQNIVVKGVVTSVNDRERSFILNDDINQITCFVPKSSLISLPQEGESIIVVGNFSLNPTNSRYQIKVTNILEDAIEMNISNVEDISNELTAIISGMQELQNIRIKGEVSQLFIDNKVSYWVLRNQKLASQIFPIIQCKCIGSTESLVQIGNEVCVQGNICLFPQECKYQIEVSHIEDITNSKDSECQCIGCEYCQKQGKNQTCTSPKNPEYELCTMCYNESPDREDRIENAVYAYFDALGSNGFSPQKKRKIQMGSDNREADVVLVNGNGNFAAIAECKGAGYVGNGIEQLNSYLSATNTRFGIFANRVDPQQWKFYMEQGQNQFDPITCDQFKTEIKKITDSDLQAARSRIQTLESENKVLKQTQRSLKGEFDSIKVYLQSAAEKIDEVSNKIDE